MDIAVRFGLRAACKHNNKAMYRALGIALIVHMLVWVYWNPFEKISAPELAEWVNITLVASFEDNQNEYKPNPQPATVPKPKSVTAEPPEQESVSKSQDESPAIKEIEDDLETTEEKEIIPSSASAFVQADSRPFALDNPKPVYPLSARRRGVQGVVLLQVNVSDEGAVTGIHIMRSSGFRILDIAALNSVKRWRFMPALQGELKVNSTVQVPIRFVLNN